ncbi:MAG: hypothetical protein ACRC76_07635 [Proteocatella sp.]
MSCDLCGNASKISKGEIIKKLVNVVFEEIAVDGEKWHILYRCKKCNAYWEERYTGGRWDGWPELYKMNEVDALDKWKNKSDVK